MNLNPTEIHTVMIGAVRYALRRMTYIVHDTADVIKNHVHELRDDTKIIIQRDIMDAINSKNYGHECDLVVWTELYQMLSKSMISAEENENESV